VGTLGAWDVCMTRHTLVVDDDEINAEMLVAGLGDAGWKATAATGVLQALALLQSGSYALVVSDIAMNDGDGFDLLRAIRTGARPVPVILMSSFGTSATARDAIDAGAFAYLAKPFPLRELLVLVARAHGAPPA
jgi:DNA-binding NtrC family response regulator